MWQAMRPIFYHKVSGGRRRVQRGFRLMERVLPTIFNPPRPLPPLLPRFRPEAVPKFPSPPWDPIC